MKNLKKLSREHLREIKGSGGNECITDADCPLNGLNSCPRCESFKGRKVCFYPLFC